MRENFFPFSKSPPVQNQIQQNKTSVSHEVILSVIVIEVDPIIVSSK